MRGANKNKDVWAPPLAHPLSDFCITAYNNFLDICVLEWCKLFGDKKGEHYWGAVVTDTVKFEKELLQHLSVDTAAFEAYRLEMRAYRDKFVAHLTIPNCALTSLPLTSHGVRLNFITTSFSTMRRRRATLLISQRTRQYYASLMNSNFSLER